MSSSPFDSWPTRTNIPRDLSSLERDNPSERPATDIESKTSHVAQKIFNNNDNEPTLFQQRAALLTAGSHPQGQPPPYPPNTHEPPPALLVPPPEPASAEPASAGPAAQQPPAAVQAGNARPEARPLSQREDVAQIRATFKEQSTNPSLTTSKEKTSRIAKNILGVLLLSVFNPGMLVTLAFVAAFGEVSTALGFFIAASSNKLETMSEERQNILKKAHSILSNPGTRDAFYDYCNRVGLPLDDSLNPLPINFIDGDARDEKHPFRPNLRQAIENFLGQNRAGNLVDPSDRSHDNETAEQITAAEQELNSARNTDTILAKRRSDINQLTVGERGALAERLTQLESPEHGLPSQEPGLRATMDEINTLLNDQLLTPYKAAFTIDDATKTRASRRDENGINALDKIITHLDYLHQLLERSSRQPGLEADRRREIGEKLTRVRGYQVQFSDRRRNIRQLTDIPRYIQQAFHLPPLPPAQEEPPPPVPDHRDESNPDQPPPSPPGSNPVGDDSASWHSAEEADSESVHSGEGEGDSESEHPVEE